MFSSPFFLFLWRARLLQAAAAAFRDILTFGRLESMPVIKIKLTEFQQMPFPFRNSGEACANLYTDSS